jgi:hypothetical protein
MTPRDQRKHPEAVRITTAAPSKAEEIAARQRRYLFSMAVRTLCVIGAVVVGDWWLRWVLIAGAVFLPYVAVVMANAANSRDDAFDLRDGSAAGHELESPPEP